MRKHTKLPWIANNNHSNPLALTRIESKNEHGIVNGGYIIAQLMGPDHEKNGEFIIRACTSQPALLAACEKLMGLRSDLLEGTTYMDEGALLTEGAEAFDDMEVAITAAGGKNE